MTGLTMTVCLRLAHAARLCWSGLRSHVSRFWPEVRGYAPRMTDATNDTLTALSTPDALSVMSQVWPSSGCRDLVVIWRVGSEGSCCVGGLFSA